MCRTQLKDDKVQEKKLPNSDSAVLSNHSTESAEAGLLTNVKANVK